MSCAVQHLHGGTSSIATLSRRISLQCEEGWRGGGDCGGDPERALEVKLTDFGLDDEGGAADDGCGTPSYCAPELLGEGHGKAVDMWSMGVLAYVVLTGVLPLWARIAPTSSPASAWALDSITDRRRCWRRAAAARRGGAGGEEEVERKRSGVISDLAKDPISRLLKLEPTERH